MKNFKSLLLVALSAATFVSASAQYTGEEDKAYPFVGFQAGAQGTFTNYDFGKLITPIVGVQLGQYFTPVVGTRLSVSGWRGKTGERALNRTFGYNYVNTDVDMLVNLSNAIAPRHTSPVDVIAIAGVGMYWARYGESISQLRRPASSSGSFDFRLGAQVDWNIAHNLSLNLELLATGLDDQFNAKNNRHLDWQASAMVGITYKMRSRKRKSAAVAPVAPVVPVVTEEPAPAPAPAPAPVPAPAPERPAAAPQKAVAAAQLFFKINSAELNATEQAKLKQFAEFMKANPSAKATLTSYADAATGTHAYNARLSQRRADTVERLLVERYGIAASRITSYSKGDSEQPHATPAECRVTICLAE